MRKVSILAVGKRLRPPFDQLCNEYTKRLGSRPELRWLWHRGEKELLEAASQMNHVIYLSEHGPTCDTRGFKRILEASPEIGFVIGPPEGFSERPQGELLSLSPLTFPHEMAMCVLVEQIYRAKTLIEGHPYHK